MWRELDVRLPTKAYSVARESARGGALAGMTPEKKCQNIMFKEFDIRRRDK